MDLYLEEKGLPGQPAVVLLHGGGLSSRMWQPQMDCLDGFHRMAPDLPEHGRSRSVSPFQLEDAARLVAELIRARVPSGKATVVGLSLGGAVALTMLRTQPDVVERTLVSGTAARLGKTLAWIAENSLWMLRFYTPEQLVAASAKQMGIPAEMRVLFDEDLRHTSSAEFTRRLYRELAEMTLPLQLPAPLLALVGEKETFAAKDAARKLGRLYPAARVASVPGVGHVWNLQAPDLFSDTVRAWAAGTPLPTSLIPVG